MERLVVKTTEAAKLLECGVSTIHWMLEEGILQSVSTPKGKIKRVSMISILAYLAGIPEAEVVAAVVQRGDPAVGSASPSSLLMNALEAVGPQTRTRRHVSAEQSQQRASRGTSPRKDRPSRTPSPTNSDRQSPRVKHVRAAWRNGRRWGFKIRCSLVFWSKTQFQPSQTYPVLSKRAHTARNISCHSTCMGSQRRLQQEGRWCPSRLPDLQRNHTYCPLNKIPCSSY